MTIGRDARRREQLPKIEAEFPGDIETVTQLLDVFERAWHDIYDEIAPQDWVIDDVFVLASGNLARLVSALHLALTDWRDLKVSAEAVRDKRLGTQAPPDS